MLATIAYTVLVFVLFYLILLLMVCIPVFASNNDDWFGDMRFHFILSVITMVVIYVLATFFGMRL
jgi:hypothetical protein